MFEGGRSMLKPPGAEKPPGGMGGGGIAAEAGGPAAGGCLKGTWTDITFASGSLHAQTYSPTSASGALLRQLLFTWRWGAFMHANLAMERFQHVALPAAAQHWRLAQCRTAAAMTQAAGNNKFLVGMHLSCLEHTALAVCCPNISMTAARPLKGPLTSGRRRLRSSRSPCWVP